MNAGAYPFELSLAELHWLAGAFGISSLPLPDATFDGLTPPQLEQRQKNGHASLLTRGLIRPSPGFGWQAERLPAALLQLISSAPSLLRLEHIPKSGVAQSLHLFTANAQGLSLEMDGDTARFVIFQTRRILQESAMRWLSLPAKIKKTTIIHELPQPLTFLPAAWNDPALATRILKEQGANARTAKSTLDWVASIEWVAALSKVKLEGNSNTITGQFALCGDGKSIWGGGDDGKNVSFVHVATKTINATMGEML
jgi:hypothetical protein